MELISLQSANVPVPGTTVRGRTKRVFWGFFGLGAFLGGKAKKQENIDTVCSWCINRSVVDRDRWENKR